MNTGPAASWTFAAGRFRGNASRVAAPVGSRFGSLREISESRFAGGPRKGLITIPNGPRFTLFSQINKDVGPWVGIDDEQGNGVLRIRGRIGRGGIWSVVKVTPDRIYADLLEPLLVLWGGISVLRQKIPWLSVTTLAASEAAIQRETKRLLRSPS